MLHLGSIRGTRMSVDISFFILVAFFVLMNLQVEPSVLHALLWVPIVFVSVLVHELAHAAMIGILGFGSSEIVLGGMGGVTMNRRRAKPWQDLLISLAGPVSSFGVMFLCTWILITVPIARQDRMLVELLPRMIWANRAWGLFNLVPVAPLDGGHAVREFFGIFFRDRTAFICYVWIAMIVGGAIVAWFFYRKAWFPALFIGFLVFRAYEQWQYFRRYGTPGD